MSRAESVTGRTGGAQTTEKHRPVTQTPTSSLARHDGRVIENVSNLTLAFAQTCFSRNPPRLGVMATSFF